MRLDNYECVESDGRIRHDRILKEASFMATDYDAPRRRAEDEIETDSLEGLKAAEDQSNGMNEDGEIVDAFEPPSVDLTNEELNVTVVPRREDEFTCSSCFLVQKQGRKSHDEEGQPICLDCA